jgi:copper transport protein
VRSWLALLGLTIVLLGWPTDVVAHAVLLRSDPPTGRTLNEAPSEVRLLFSEPIDASFSHVQVVDDAGNPVDRGDSHVDPNDERELVVSLVEDLPDGVYTVRWRSLSTIDIHPGSGQYPLFVGVPVTATATSASVVQNESTAATTFARWWLYVAAAGFAGTLAAWKFVFAPVFVGEYAPMRSTALRRLERLAAVAGALLLLGTLFAALAQAAAAAGVSLDSAFGAPLRDLLTRGRYASIWWPRLVISVLAVALVRWRGLDDVWSESAVAMAPAILLTNSLTSHAATLPGEATLGIVADWLHVMGAAVWVGGLASLAVLVRYLVSSADLRNRVLTRFSRLGLIGVVVIGASGTVQTVLEVGSWAALFGTPYGIGVLIKIGLLAAMLGLAGLNTWRFRKDAVAFSRGVRIELTLGVLALAVAAVLTGTAPARQAG